MQSKDGKEFFQTYDKDAEFIAEMLNRRTVTSTANKYISLSPHEVETIRNQIGTENLAVEEYAHKTPYTTRHETGGEAGRPHPPVTVTPSSRIEYIVSPIMRTNKVTQQMERVPGMFALTITADGISLDSKTLTRQERDLLNDHPSEITNIINHKFANDLGSATISFKQVHRPAVTDRQWQNLSLPNGITFDSLPRMYRNTVTGKHEMTATIDSMTIGPKTMARHDVNDFFDHALPAAEIAARVFRVELEPQVAAKGVTAQNFPASKITPDEVIKLWQAAHTSQEKDTEAQTIAFIRREGKYDAFYQTFGDDAKNMAKVTNRALRVIDTDSHKDMIYATIPESQIHHVVQQLRDKDFQTFAVDTNGQTVPITAGKKTETSNSITLDDGQTVDHISLRNAGGQWLMSAYIGGRPLNEREISHNDAAVFKHGQQDMAAIVLKYFADDFKTSQQHSPKQTPSR